MATIPLYRQRHTGVAATQIRPMCLSAIAFAAVFIFWITEVLTLVERINRQSATPSILTSSGYPSGQDTPFPSSLSLFAPANSDTLAVWQVHRDSLEVA